MPGYGKLPWPPPRLIEPAMNSKIRPSEAAATTADPMKSGPKLRLWLAPVDQLFVVGS